MIEHWLLDPSVTYLNHGSFGACPRRVLAYQQAQRDELESEPVQFMDEKLAPRLDAARTALAELAGAAPTDMVFVANATAGVGAVLRSIDWRDGDEIVVSSHAYPACRNAAEFVAERSGGRVVVADVPFPCPDPELLYERFVAAVGPRARLAILDHVASPTAILMPLARIARELRGRGIEILVDGAHAPGMLDLDIPSLGVDYYTGNCHKWLCAPKGAAFLWVAPEHQDRVIPTSVSVGLYEAPPGRSLFHARFDWVGTDDPTAMLSVPEAIRFLSELYPGGLAELRRKNHELAVRGREILCDALDIEPPCPVELLGSMASLPLPGAPADLGKRLFAEHKIEVPIKPNPGGPPLLRISAQAYNEEGQYQRLADVLGTVVR